MKAIFDIDGGEQINVQSGNFYYYASEPPVIAVTHLARRWLGLRGRRLRGCSQLEVALGDSPAESEYTMRKSHHGGVST